MRFRNTLHPLLLILPLALIAATSASSATEPDSPRVKDAGFESDPFATWGNGPKLPAWWNRNGCSSTAAVDNAVYKFGSGSLHLRSLSGRAPHVYGTTAQNVPILPKQRYRIALWARGRNLSSNGAVQIIVDPDWKIRPIQLPKGSFDWTRFEAVFSLSSTTAPIRILIEDAGEAWLDALEITPLDSTPARQAVLADALQQFRTAAIADFSRAVADWGTEQCVKQLEHINTSLWPHTEPKTGWSYQINLSLLATGDLSSQHPIVGYYNPWSDVLLVTTWSEKPSGFRVESVDVLMGELVRNRSTRVPVPVPGWQLEDTYRPAAVARVAGRTISAFERTLDGLDGRNWLDGFPSLKDRTVREDLNYRGCALQLANSLRRVQDFYIPTKDEAGIFALARDQTRTFLEHSTQGQVAKMLRTSSGTLPNTADALCRTPAECFRGLVTASMSVAGNEAVVFLVSPGNPSGFISLDIDGAKGKAQLKRVDVVSFEAACQSSSPPLNAAPTPKK